mmetsp:Transcript_4502/g.5219  ORF Transcript_4502/g.5219 Transcript_4502/m.5219 type:complete len:131 (-) Transcript_4502:235-627(-)
MDDLDDFVPARPILRLLKESGVTDWDPRVVYQLLEYQNSLIEELVSDAKEFAHHRGKKSLSEEDVKLATLSRNVTLNKPKPTPLRLGLRQTSFKVRAQQLPHIQPTEKLRLPKSGTLIMDNFETFTADNS